MQPKIRSPKGGTATRVIIVGVGASAGGLEAFTQLLKHLPLDTGMGFVLIQHLDPDHESALTQILSRATALPVHEIVSNQTVEVNHVYIIPRDTNLTIVHGVLELEPRERRRMPHRPIDRFFESLAQDQGERAIGVVLSGTANDGTLGLEAIKAEGGITFAQDSTAKYDSMPRSAIAANCVDLVLSPEKIAEELARIAKHPYRAWHSDISSGLPANEATRHQEAIGRQDDDQTPTSGGRDRARHRATDAGNGHKKIILLLRNHSGVDFSLYKPSTIQRRINRRVIITRQDSLEAYAQFLRGNSQELDALFSDVLISVTSFFRNPEMFESLQRDVLPGILAQGGNDPVRCWVLGCSSGQEAYSFAISFVEVMGKMLHARKLQVFATDINEKLLEKARHGWYPKTLLEDISPERLRRFFQEEEGGYRIRKFLRELVVFARQNLITDPPFSRMDLISCRNLLIYLDPSEQQKAFPRFHYALKSSGYLILGASESIGTFTDLFEPKDRKHKIFMKKPSPAMTFHLGVMNAPKKHISPKELPPFPESKREPKEGMEQPDGIRGGLNPQREADRVAARQFAPPGVLINDQLQVLQFRGPTGAYLEPAAGMASFDLLTMAREGLMLPLRAAINKARQENKIVRAQHVRVRRDGKTHHIHVKVIPLKNLRERCFLIAFEDAAGSERGAPRVPSRKQPAAPALSPRLESRRIAELESELSETREFLQSVQEQNQAINEEIQATSEEVQSANEELQSINEELETSKEELESANEELTTVNEEMSNRNIELNRLNNDLVNLQTSAKLAIVLLGRDLTIRRFSPQAERQFDLLAADVGRPISGIRHGLVSAGSAESPLDLETLSVEVISELREQEHEVRDKGGRWYSLRVRPYMTLDNMVDGVVLVLVDIDAIKRSEQAAAAARNYAENTVEAVHQPLLVLDDQLRVESANKAFYQTFRVTPAQTLGASLNELGNRRWDIPRLHGLLEEMQSQNTRIEKFQVEGDFPQLGRRTMLLHARPISDPRQKTSRILLAIEDITERKQTEIAQARLAAIVEYSEDAILGKDLHGTITSWNRGAQRLFGYTEQEAVGQQIMIVIPPEQQDKELLILERVRRGESSEQIETVRRRKDGSLVTVSVTVSPIKNSAGEVVGASSIARDITERKEAQARLLQSGAELERAVKAKTAEVVHSHERLRAMTTDLNLTEQRERKRLAAELHDHLAQLLVLGKLKLGQSRRSNQPQEKRDELITETDELLSDALTYTRTLVADLSPPVLYEFGLEAAFKWLAEKMQRHGLTVMVQSETEIPKLPDDQTVLLFQSVRELLMNVAKHAKSGTATVRLECRSGELRIEVQDRGEGFHHDALAADDISRSQKFGLFSVRERIQALGGRFDLNSVPGEGTTAVITVKLTMTQVEGMEQETGTNEEAAQSTPFAASYLPSVSEPIIRVLLVDDHTMMRQGLRSVLDAHPDVMVVGEAVDGEEAVAAAEALQPSLIVMDINMPKLNGIEATAQIKSRYPHIIVIGLSVNTGDANEKAMKEAGAAVLLTKEAAVDELYEAIHRAVRGAH
jgi:two-component system CheB/CheR fusion protein